MALELHGDYAYIAYAQPIYVDPTGGGGIDIIAVDDPLNLRRVGGYSSGADVYDLTIAGQYAYVTELPFFDGTSRIAGGLRVLDISQPQNAKLIGSYNADDLRYPRGVAVSGSYVYVADATEELSDLYTYLGEGGLHVFDVSLPANPKRVGRYSSHQHLGVTGYADVAIAWPYAYAAGAGRLDVIDISDPAQIRLVGVSYHGGEGFSIMLRDRYALLGERLRHCFSRGCVFHGRFNVIDILDPTWPQLLASFDWGRMGVSAPTVPTSSLSAQMAMLGPRLALAGSELTLFDIGKPDQPQEIGRYPAEVSNVKLIGNLAYATSGNNLLVFHLDPANPQRISGLNIDGGASSVAVAGDYAYVAEAIQYDGDRCDNGCYYATGGLHVIRISDVNNPKRVGSYQFSSPALDVAVLDNYAYLAESQRGLEAVDVSDPATPRIVGSLSFFDPAGYRDYVQSVEVSGRYAYVAVADRGPNAYPVGGGLQVVDIRDPANLRHVAGYATAADAVNLALSGSYAYLATEGHWRGGRYTEGGLLIFDITNPLDPRLVSQLNADWVESVDIAISGSHAYLGSWFGAGLRVIDISNPANPVAVGSYPTSGSDLAVCGGYVYVLNDLWGLQVFDIRDPRSPRYVGGNPNVDGLGITIANNKLFVADAGLTILHAYEPIRFEQILRQDSAMGLRITGPPGVPARVQRSGDLRNWNDWLPISFGESPLEISDPTANSQASGFYRVAVP